MRLLDQSEEAEKGTHRLMVKGNYQMINIITEAEALRDLSIVEMLLIITLNSQIKQDRPTIILINSCIKIT